MIKKADIALFFLLLAAGLVVSFASLSADTGDKVLITVSGETYGTYDLSKDQTIHVSHDGHTNNITIKDGSVSMSYSDCANQVCVHTGAISQAKDSIVCLPNRVMVEIIDSKAGGDVDVISG